MSTTCTFCEIVADRAPAEILHRWFVEAADGSAMLEVAAFTPLTPVTPGHALIVPQFHIEHAAVDPSISAAAMNCAADWAATRGGDYNIITSGGPAASQTVRHLHVHYVPRRPDDGLALPWTARTG